MKKDTERYPKDFLWGAATAAHQVEGNNHNQWTEWELRTAQEKADTASLRFKDFPIWDSIQSQAGLPHTYISGILTDHYNHYEEDFDLLTAMNMNAYRFSIEWSRIEPVEGTWNANAIEHYKQYIESLKSRAIEPIVTLFHFSIPVWFSELGGFEKRFNVRYFVRFVEKIMSEIGDDVRYVITVNEPEVYVEEAYIACNFPPQTKSLLKAWKVFNNLVYAHNRAADVIHKIGPHLQVSISKDSAYYFPGDNRLITRLFVRLKYYIRDDYYLKRVRKTCDFFGSELLFF